MVENAQLRPKIDKPVMQWLATVENFASSRKSFISLLPCASHTSRSPTDPSSSPPNKHLEIEGAKSPGQVQHASCLPLQVPALPPLLPSLSFRAPCPPSGHSDLLPMSRQKAVCPRTGCRRRLTRYVIGNWSKLPKQTMRCSEVLLKAAILRRSG